MVVLEPPLVAAELLLHPVDRALEGGVDLLGSRGGLHGHAGGQVHRRIGDELVTITAEGDDSLHRPVEVLGDGLVQPLLDVRPQSVADVDLLSADLDAHALPRFPWPLLSARPSGGTYGQARFRCQSRAPIDALSDLQSPESEFFRRRRCTDDGMPMSSRYFATVRRAISIPSPFRRATILSSDSGPAGRSAWTRPRIRSCTAAAEKASPPETAWIAELKK